MGHSYTSKGAPEPFEFELDGETFVCSAGVSLLDLSKLAMVADESMESMEGVSAIHELFKGALGGDYERFRQHTRTHHTDTDTIMEIMRDLIEHVTSGPTTRPPRSAGGPQITNGTYEVSLPSRELSDDEIQRIRERLGKD